MKIIKFLLLIPFLLSSFLIYAQTKSKIPSTWRLPFSDMPTMNETIVKKEIEKVLTAFGQANNALDLNLKLVDDKEKGFIDRVYSYKGKLIATEWVRNGGENASRTCYLDDHQNIRLVVDNEHGNTWFNDIYSYILGENNRLLRFEFRTDEISYDNKGTGHYKEENIPLSQKLGKVKLLKKAEQSNDLDNDDLDYKELQNTISLLLQKAEYLEKNRVGIHYFKGEVDWKYAIIMQLEILNNGQINGKYRYKKSKANLQLKGQLTEERFALTETDSGGKTTGLFKVRFIEAAKAEGKWYKPNDKKNIHYIDLSPVASYAF